MTDDPITAGSHGHWFGEDDVWLLEDVRDLEGSDSAHVRRALALYLGLVDAAESEGVALDDRSDRELRAWMRQLVLDDLRGG